jgi:hypothetical protein
MTVITRFLKGLFYFFVGDWIILTGVIISVVVVTLLANLNGMSGWSGLILFAGIAFTLALTLHRETSH